MRFLFRRCAALALLAFLFVSTAWTQSVMPPNDQAVGGKMGANSTDPGNWMTMCGNRQPDKAYTLTITAAKFNNYAHTMIHVNGQFPGPLLVFNENDCVAITLDNKLQDYADSGNFVSYNSTVHFHGQHFHGSPWADGVPGVTQCLVPPMSKMTYYFAATAVGTSWYHGHYDGQYTSGLFGPYIVVPKQQSSYMTNVNAEWIAILSDGYINTYQTLINFVMSPQDFTGEEPLPDYMMINGLQDRQLAFDATKGSKVLLRFINSAALTLNRISIDSVVMQVVEIDGSPVIPYSVSDITIGVAQRISVILDFSANDMTKYNAVWIRIDNTLMPTERLRRQTMASISFTGTATNQYYRGRALMSSDIPNYNAIPTMPATFKGSPVVTPSTSDWNLLDARPVFPIAAPDATLQLQLALSFAFGADGIFYAYFNGITYNQIAHHMQYPLLYQTQDSVAAADLELPMSFYNPSLAMNQLAPGPSSFMYDIPAGAVVDVIINNTDTGTHPIHFHGYRFWVIDSDQNSNSSMHTSYIQRDVVNVAPLGWSRFRFVANNPGSWVLHCHIDWHFEEGLATILNVDPLSFATNPMPAPVEHQQICNYWQSQENAAFAANVAANSFTPTTTTTITAADAAVGTFIANTIICVESIFALAIYKMGIMYSILFDLVALNVGTLLGVCWIELEHEMWIKVSSGTLKYEIVAFLLCAGGMLPYIFEKFVKRGRVNKFAWLKHTQGTPTSTDAAPVVDKDIRPAAPSMTGSEAELEAKEAANESQSDSTGLKKPASHLKAPSTGNGEHAKKPSTSISRAIVFHLAGNWEDEGDEKSGPRHHHKRSSSQATLKDVQVEMNSTMPTLNEGEEPETPVQRPVAPLAVAVTTPAGTKHVDAPASPSRKGQNAAITGAQDVPALTLESKPGVNDTRNGDGVVLDPTKHGEYKMAKAATQEMDIVLILVMLAGDMLHNFVDGSIIASAFLTSNAIGLATSLGIFLEELPHLIGTFAVFVHAGAPVWKAVALSVFGAFPFLIGGALIIGVAADSSVNRAQISYLLAFAVGSFLYITLADLVPVLTSQWNGGKRAVIQTICVLVGMGIQAGIAVYNTHEGEDAHQFALPNGGVFDPT